MNALILAASGRCLSVTERQSGDDLFPRVRQNARSAIHAVHPFDENRPLSDPHRGSEPWFTALNFCSTAKNRLVVRAGWHIAYRKIETPSLPSGTSDGGCESMKSYCIPLLISAAFHWMSVALSALLTRLKPHEPYLARKAHY